MILHQTNNPKEDKGNMEEEPLDGGSSQKGEYVQKIANLIERCNDIDLLDFVFQLLTKSNQLAI